MLSSAEDFLRSNRLGYTNALGVDPLRGRIARFYKERHDLDVSPSKIQSKACLLPQLEFDATVLFCTYTDVFIL